MMSNYAHVSDRVYGLCKSLIEAGFYDKALELSEEFLTLEQLVLRTYPTNLSDKPHVAQSNVSLRYEHYLQVLHARERYRDELYNQYLKCYELLLI